MGLFDLDESLKKTEEKPFAKELKKANSLIIREEYERAEAIYNEILDEDDTCLEAYLGLLRVHSEDYAKFDGERIEKDIRVINKVFDDIDDEDFLDYLKRRKKARIKAEEEEKEKTVQKKTKGPKAKAQRKLTEDDEEINDLFKWLSGYGDEIDEIFDELDDEEIRRTVEVLIRYSDAGVLQARAALLDVKTVCIFSSEDVEEMLHSIDYKRFLLDSMDLIKNPDPGDKWHIFFCFQAFISNAFPEDRIIALAETLVKKDFHLAYYHLASYFYSYHKYEKAIPYFAKYLSLPYKAEAYWINSITGKVTFYEDIPIQERNGSLLFEAAKCISMSYDVLALDLRRKGKDDAKEKALTEAWKAVSKDIQGGMSPREAMRKHGVQ